MPTTTRFGVESLLVRRRGEKAGVVVHAGTVRFEGVSDRVGAVEVEVAIADEGERPRVVTRRFVVEDVDGAGLRSRDVTACRPGRWIEEAVRRLSRVVETAPDGSPRVVPIRHTKEAGITGAPGSGVPAADLAFAQAGVVEPRRHSWELAELERVAEVWRAASRPRGRAVAAEFGLSDAAARKVIELARNTGADGAFVKGRTDGLIPRASM